MLNLLESAGMMYGAAKSAGRSRLWRQIGRQRSYDLVAATRTIGELDRDWLVGTLGDCTVQLLYCTLCFDPLVEPNESYSFRKTWRQYRIGYLIPYLYVLLWGIMLVRFTLDTQNR